MTKKIRKPLSFLTVVDQQYVPVPTLTHMLGMTTDIKILDFINEVAKEEPVQLLSKSAVLQLCDYLGTHKAKMLKKRLRTA